MHIPEQLLQSIEQSFPRGRELESFYRFISYLENAPAQKLQMLTYSDVASILGKQSVDNEVLQTIAILTSSTCHVLDSKLLFIDRDTGEEFELNDDQARLAVLKDEFAHPEKGTLVPNFKKMLHPFFTLTSELNEGHK